MAMQMQSKVDASPLMEMNATPLIDVMLVMLIMFIITVPIVTHSVQLSTPGVGVAKPAEILSVDIEYGEVITLNGEVITPVALERYFQQASRRSPQPVLKLQSHDRARYETVAQVLAMAQRNGIERISLAPTPL